MREIILFPLLFLFELSLDLRPFLHVFAGEANERDKERIDQLLEELYDPDTYEVDREEDDFDSEGVLDWLASKSVHSLVTCVEEFF